MSVTEGRWLKREEAAEIAGVSVKTIDKWIRTKQLRAGKPSRKITRIHTRDLDDAMRRGIIDDDEDDE